MAPADEEEALELRFVEDDDDTGPKPWRADTPAVFLDCDWQRPGELLGVENEPQLQIPLSMDFSLAVDVMRHGEVEAESRIISSDGWMLAAGAKVRFATGAAMERSSEEPPEDAPDAPPAESPGSEIVGLTSIDDGHWHHVAVVFKAETGIATVFVDGQWEGEEMVEVDTESGPSSGLVVLGQEEGETPHSKDFKVFWKALSPSQIHGLMTDSKDLGTGLTLSMLPDQVDEYWRLKAEDAEGARALLQQTVAADPLQREFQQEVLLDLFEDFMTYAKTICLTSRKTSVFVQILKQLLDMMHRKSETSRRFGETTSIFECFQAYKRMLVAHSHAAFATAKPRSSEDGDPSMATLGVFRSADVRLLTDFVTGALFQQFLLYQCVLICPQDSVTSYTEVELLQPLPPPDLKKAVSKKKAAQAKAGNAKRAYAARSKETTAEVSPEDAEAETEGVSLDQTFSQFPKDLTIDEHHEESTKAAEATAKTSIRRHDKDLTQPS